MNIKHTLILLAIALHHNSYFAGDSLINAISMDSCANNEDRSLEQILQLTDHKKQANTMVPFDYTNENLTNIINTLASAQGINILFPVDSDKIDIEVTLNLKHKISLSEAWGIVNTFLDVAGFTLVPRGITYEITPNKDINKEPLTTYINIHPEQLPNDESKVRYLYYLQNINLSGTNNKSKANLETILRDMLAGQPASSNYLLDGKSNSILITNKTSNIKAAMHIIMSLDREGFREAIEIVQLRHTNAKNIVDLLNKVIENKKNNPQFRYGAPANDSEEVYFSKTTSIVPIERSNSIAIMGKLEAVEKVKNFITKYLDVSVEGGKSIIHIKELQHIDAGELAKVLQKIIKARTEGAQSSGTRDALSEVIITAEQDESAEQMKPLEIDKINPAEQAPVKPKTANNLEKKAIAGNNCLVIAAREPEWIVLERLIDEIDKPQLQVAIETLIVDLIVTDNNTIASQTRNLNFGGNPQPADFQSAQIGIPGGVKVGNNTLTGGPVLNYVNSTATPTPQGLASDLITASQAITSDTGAVTYINKLVDIVNASGKGSTLISFDDGEGIASLLQVFSGYANAKVLSQPFVTTQNHQQAAMSSITSRIVPGSVQEQSVGGPAIIKRDTIDAKLKIDVLPRISHAGVINLEIIVHVDEFVTQNTDNNTITSRKVHTNANVSDKQVLVIGGLTKVSTINTISGLPIISKIPLLGDFFKQRNQKTEKSTLMVFVAPKIIKPRAGISRFTQSKIQEAMDSIKLDELAFDNLSDPVTRILFPAQADKTNKLISDFADQNIFVEQKQKGPITSKI